MTKEYIAKVLGFKGTDKDISVAVNRVTDTLKAIPADANLGAMTSVENFHENGFGSFQYSDSRLDSEREKEKARILNNLRSILLEVTTWIKNNPLQVKYNILTVNHSKDRCRRKKFIAALVIIALIAVVLTIIQHTTSLIPQNIPVAEIVGLVDMLIGIGGFIYELADDNKKEAVCNAVKEISESETDKELTGKAKNLAKVVNKIDNSQFKVSGWFNHIKYHDN